MNLHKYHSSIKPLRKAIDALPVTPGSYALLLQLRQRERLAVGKLGIFDFLPGGYVYFGSARGSGGIRARLGRHLRGAGKLHWHIDFLRTSARVSGYFYLSDDVVAELPVRTRRSLECIWSQRCAQNRLFQLAAPGFGASDCINRCESHLYRFSERDVSTDAIRSMMADAVGVGSACIVGAFV